MVGNIRFSLSWKSSHRSSSLKKGGIIIQEEKHPILDDPYASTPEITWANIQSVAIIFLVPYFLDLHFLQVLALAYVPFLIKHIYERQKWKVIIGDLLTITVLLLMWFFQYK